MKAFSHPIIRGALGTAAFIAVAEWLVWLTSAAWAVVIPIGTYRIDFGDVPQWIIAIVAGIGMWKSWKAEQHALIAVAKIEEVRHETNSMRAALELSKIQEGRKQVHDETAAAASAAKETKEDNRVEAVADAKAAAEVRASDAESPAPKK